MLITAVQQSDSVIRVCVYIYIFIYMYPFFFLILFSIMVYHRISPHFIDENTEAREAVSPGSQDWEWLVYCDSKPSFA